MIIEKFNKVSHKEKYYSYLAKLIKVQAVIRQRP